MISASTIAELEARKLEYILGGRERSDAIVKEIVLNNTDRFVPLLIERKRGETQLFVKPVMVEDKRYIVCRNEAEADKDRQDREAIIARLLCVTRPIDAICARRRKSKASKCSRSMPEKSSKKRGLMAPLFCAPMPRSPQTRS
jgi:hypothetical protein